MEKAGSKQIWGLESRFARVTLRLDLQSCRSVVLTFLSVSIDLQRCLVLIVLIQPQHQSQRASQDVLNRRPATGRAFFKLSGLTRMSRQPKWIDLTTSSQCSHETLWHKLAALRPPFCLNAVLSFEVTAMWRVLWYAAQTSMQAKPGKTLRVDDSYKVVDSSNRSAFVLIGVRVLLSTCCQERSSQAYL